MILNKSDKGLTTMTRLGIIGSKSMIRPNMLFQTGLVMGYDDNI